MTEEQTNKDYLLSRINDKDKQIEEFQNTIKKLKEELMEVCHWIEDYHENEKVTLFEWSKLRAHLCAVHKNASERDYS